MGIVSPISTQVSALVRSPHLYRPPLSLSPICVRVRALAQFNGGFHGQPGGGPNDDSTGDACMHTRCYRYQATHSCGRILTPPAHRLHRTVRRGGPGVERHVRLPLLRGAGQPGHHPSLRIRGAPAQWRHGGSRLHTPPYPGHCGWVDGCLYQLNHPSLHHGMVWRVRRTGGDSCLGRDRVAVHHGCGTTAQVRVAVTCGHFQRREAHRGVRRTFGLAANTHACALAAGRRACTLPPTSGGLWSAVCGGDRVRSVVPRRRGASER